ASVLERRHPHAGPYHHATEVLTGSRREHRLDPRLLRAPAATSPRRIDTRARPPARSSLAWCARPSARCRSSQHAAGPEVVEMKKKSQKTAARPSRLEDKDLASVRGGSINGGGALAIVGGGLAPAADGVITSNN